MNIDEAKDAREKLESELCGYLNGRLDRFREATGLTPNRVEVKTLCVKQNNGHECVYVEAVRVVCMI